ncbi:MAG: M1 family metallopeptidase [Bacteroidales bacterium]|jgi:aminopeptidase N|nr:M1 family metallopeptidase [Bacteroidales bacterium]
MKKISLLVLSLMFLTFCVSAQQQRIFTRQDTLRGSITPEREWWDLNYYHLDIKVDPGMQTIYGTNTVTYRVMKPATVMQIDLQEPLVLSGAVQDGRELLIRKDGNAHFITLQAPQKPGEVKSVTLHYGGKPRVSQRPPWSGGITWAKDNDGNHYIASACQGDGASLWWPCKDHMYDEPDSMLISVNVPANLTNVSNGRLRKVEQGPDKTQTWHWFVSNPISNYVVNINIGNYVSFSDVYQGEKGPLDCQYWVLPYNLEKAREHFKQAHLMLEAFEHWFGPYPFYEDSYKLVDVPYTGMEHQSSVTYGNGYRNGYGGRDQSGTGWGDLFDFIIIHESGHEWFANSITYKDIADMWVHESFINYSENLFVEYFHGKAAGSEYVLGTRRSIRNDRPIVGLYDVNYSGSGDMYSKGGNMLHTLRQWINDDVKWRDLLRALNRDFYHQTVTGTQIENYMSEFTGLDLRPFFDQYLRDVRIPTLEYYVNGQNITYRWANCVQRFNMPLKVTISGKEHLLTPSTRWTTLNTETDKPVLVADANWYAATINLTGK